MKLGTVLSELPVTAFYVHGTPQLDWEVVVSPERYAGEPAEGLIRLATPEELRRLGAPGDGGGLVLVYAQGPADESLAHPERSVVRAFGEVTPVEFRDAFLHLVVRSGLLAVRRQRLFKAYLSSYDIKQFARHAAEILGNPLIISNADRKVLASAGDFPPDAQDVRHTLESGYVPNEVQQLMEEDGFIGRIRSAGQAVVSDKGSTGVRNVSALIYHHHLEMGRLDVFEVQPMAGMDLELVDYAGSLVGIMIDRLGVAGGRGGMGSSVFEDLLCGRLASVDTMRALVALREGGEPGRYVLVSVVGEKGADRDYYLKAGQVVERSLKGVIWTVHGSALVLLLPLGKGDEVGFDDYERCESAVLRDERFSAMLEHNGMHAYVCEPYGDLSLSQRALAQCQDLERALEGAADGAGAAGSVAGNAGGTARIHFFWHERFVVMGASARADGKLDALLDKRVLAMADYDRRRRTSYLQTAIMSVRYPGEPVAAAEALSVHRNTYFYRVNKIRELFYLDLKEGEDRLAVAFTAHVMGLEGGTGAAAEGTGAGA